MGLRTIQQPFRLPWIILRHIKKSVIFTNGIYPISSLLKVKNGTKALLGFGGEIKATNANCGIVLAGKYSGETENVKNCDINGLVINADGYGITGIHGENVQESTVSNNTIINIVDGYGILFRSYLAGEANTFRVNISNNRVFLNDNSYGVSKHAIALDVLNAELNFAPYADDNAHYAATFTAADATYYPDSCSVTDNIISGGYYGVSLAAARRCVISGNNITSNTRNISVQHVCLYNTISNNVCSQSASSGIHMASGSKYNVISGNKIRNTADGGEALIQAYKECTDNLISGNSISALGTNGNQYFIYIGPKCDRCVVDGNSCNGNTTRGGICIESAWNTAIPSTFSYAYGKTLTAATDSDLLNVVVTNNVVLLGTVVPAISLFGVSLSSDFDLIGCKISGNKIIGNTPYKQLYIYEYGASVVSSVHLTDNMFDTTSGSTRFDMPRGRLHFALISNNLRLNTEIVTFTNGDTTPSVAYGSNAYSCNNTSPTSITYFDDGADGQEISIKLSINTTIVHASSYIRLKGDVNIVASSSNQIVTFRRYSGIWFEIGRNF